jgi:hypothetical protein
MLKKIEIIGFVMGWFAVIAQLVLIIHNRQADIAETIIRFISFFTILTNILVALFFTSKVFGFSRNLFSIFHKNSTITAITTFILIVGLIYQFILRAIWEPQGLQQIVDELLHTIIPLNTLIYWILYPQKERISLKKTTIWLLYPAVYMALVLLRGKFSNYYPYPFFNIQEIGVEKVLLNGFLILMLMIFIMYILALVKNKTMQPKN